MVSSEYLSLRQTEIPYLFYIYNNNNKFCHGIILSVKIDPQHISGLISFLILFFMMNTYSLRIFTVQYTLQVLAFVKSLSFI